MQRASEPNVVTLTQEHTMVWKVWVSTLAFIHLIEGAMLVMIFESDADASLCSLPTVVFCLPPVQSDGH